MELKAAIQARRSIKSFDPNHRMTDDEIKTLMELAILSPTAFNIQHWRFVIVTDPELRQQIKQVSWDQPQVTDASLLIVLTGDLNAWTKSPERYWKDAPEAVKEALIPAIEQYYNNKPEVQRDEVMRSCGMAAMNLMLVAQDLGYDTCPMDGFDFGKVAQLLKLPDDHTPALFVVVGKRLKDPWPRPGQLDLDEVVKQNHF
ncbi:MAG: nitroreductase family protein [Methylophilaceae bacterium]|jgi:nitroreductase